MFSSLPLRTFALSSRFTDTSRSALDLSQALKYTHATCTAADGPHSHLHSQSLLIAYAPAFHAISPSPRSLDLSHNALADEHADILASVIAPHATSIRSLDISGNPGLCVAALAYLIDPLTHLTRFHGSIPAAEAAPAELAPLLDVAGFAPALAVLALIFPPLPDPQPAAAAARPDAMHVPGKQHASHHPPEEELESSHDQACPPVATAGSTATHLQRFKALQQLCLVNLPAASEAEMLAEFPLSQLRMLDMSTDMHASHAHTFTSTSTLKPAAPQPIGSAALATLSAAPTPFPQLKALNLRGRCMHAPHAHSGSTSPLTCSRAEQPALTTPFRNLLKLARLDAGLVPVFAATDGPALYTSPGAEEMDCTTATVDESAGAATASRVKAPLRALATVATDASPDLPHVVAMMTALTALEVRGIACRPAHTARPHSAVHAASAADTGSRVQADAWGRAVLQLPNLHMLTLAHELMCGEAAAQSAASCAHALAAGPTGLASLDLAWHAPAGSAHAWAHRSGAAAPDADCTPRQSVPMSSGGGSGDRAAHGAHPPPTGFAQLVSSLGRLSALTSLTLRVPVRIPWRAIQEQVSRLSALQQLALDACMASESDSTHDTRAAHAPCAAEGSPEVLQSVPWTAVFDVTGTMQGLAHLGALTAIRLRGAGALHVCRGADAVAPPEAVAKLAEQDTRMSSGPEHEVDRVLMGGAHVAAATLERLKAAAGQAGVCRTRGSGQCRVCDGAGGAGADGLRFEAAAVAAGGLARVRELALAAGAGVRVDVGEVCGVVAGMPQLQRLEVVTGGAGLVDAEKRRVWESAGRAPLLRGIRLR